MPTGDPIEQRIREAEALEELATSLELLLSGGYGVGPDGSLCRTRKLVERLRGLRIEIYPREHAPPHFHVIAPNIDVSFAISDCGSIEGDIDKGSRKLIYCWYQMSRDKLIAEWNASRPSDCPVGPV